MTDVMTNAAAAADVANVASEREQWAERGYYVTQELVVERFIKRWKKRRPAPKTILEPSAGDGAIVRVLRRHFPEAEITARDVQPQGEGIEQADFFLPWDERKYDLIITNPPYEHALPFAVRGLNMLAPGGELVLLLRLGFLASQERRSFWRSSMAHRIYVLSERPSFGGAGKGKTDFSEYAWYVWREGHNERRALLFVL